MKGQKNGKTGFFVCILLLFVAACAGTQTVGIQKNVPALKEVFAEDFTVGCILSYKHVGFPSDPRVSGQSAVVAPFGGDLVTYHMGSMTPGNNMKPMYTVDIAASAAACASASGAARAAADTRPVVRFNGDLIAQLDWAKRNGFTFRGHTLVWHNQTPAELFTTGFTAAGGLVSRDIMLKRMDWYIGEVIRLLHEGWPGLVSAMDVVNEAVSDDGTPRTAGNGWYDIFGDASYVKTAFALARKYTVKYGETQMKLYYNDYNTADPVKADGIVRLCKPIFQAGYLDGIGMQEHDSVNAPRAEDWIRSYDKFSPICAEMAVTELDVTTNSGTNYPSQDVLRDQANRYAALFKCFIERSARSGRGKIVSVSKDGLNDEFTFVANQSTSLWDAHYRCKPAFFAVVETAKYYRELAALIKSAEEQGNGASSAQAAGSVSAALKSAREALAANYSHAESAPDALRGALEGLQKAMRP